VGSSEIIRTTQTCEEREVALQAAAAEELRTSGVTNEQNRNRAGLVVQSGLFHLTVEHIADLTV